MVRAPLLPPSARRVRRLAALAIAAGLLALSMGMAYAETHGPRVEVVEAHGVVDRVLANHVVSVIEGAGDAGAAVVVIEIDAPGALGDGAQRVIDAIDNSPVPVVAWVGPPGAHASRGALAIAEAAHLLVAAPGTLLGPAGPADLAAGAPPGEGVVAVAPPGDPDAALPDGARLPDGVAAADVLVRSAADLVDDGVIDLHAPTLSEALAALDGREATIADGPVTLQLQPDAAVVRFNNLGLFGQVLHALTSPSLVYVLLVGGALALLFEVFQPGFGVAGVSGVALLALAAYGLVVLPVSLLGVALVVAGFLLLAGDLALGRLGLLTVLGALAFGGGSALLFTGPPVLSIPYWLIALATVTNLVFFIGVMTSVLRAQGNQAVAGAERVVGETGVVRSMLNPEGHVYVGGALWRARAPEEAGRVRTGTPVRVVGLNDRLTLEVEPVVAGQREPSAS